MASEDNQYNDSFLKETLDRAFGEKQNLHIPMGISRYDHGRTHGWWVRVRREGTPFSKFYSDSLYNSIKESLEAAIIYRHKLLSSFPSKGEKYIHPRSLSMNAEDRITFIDEAGKKSRYQAWEAKWYDENHKINRKSFSIRKYGEAEARNLALKTTKKYHNKTPKFSYAPDPYLKQKFTTISREEVKIFASINSNHSKPSEKNDRPIAEDPFAFEGEKMMELHLKIERNQAFRNKKIADFTDKNDDIYCELCGFNFKNTFPFLEKNIIEVHHIVPLAKLNKKTKIELTDLMLLCSNCHFAIHQGDAETNLIIALDHFAS